MSDRAAVLEVVAREALDLEDHGTRTELRASVWSPPGRRFVASGCHVLSYDYLSDRPAGWSAMLEDLLAGLEPCDAHPCDTCDEETP